MKQTCFGCAYRQRSMMGRDMDYCARYMNYCVFAVRRGPCGYERSGKLELQQSPWAGLRALFALLGLMLVLWGLCATHYAAAGVFDPPTKAERLAERKAACESGLMRIIAGCKPVTKALVAD